MPLPPSPPTAPPTSNQYGRPHSSDSSDQESSIPSSDSSCQENSLGAGTEIACRKPSLSLPLPPSPPTAPPTSTKCGIPTSNNIPRTPTKLKWSLPLQGAATKKKKLSSRMKTRKNKPTDTSGSKKQKLLLNYFAPAGIEPLSGSTESA